MEVLQDTYKDTKIGRIPKDWEVLQIKDIVTFEKSISYGVLKPGEYIPNGIPMIQIKDVKANKVSVNDLHLISEKLDEQYRRTKLKGGEIVISLVGTIGKIAIIPKLLENGNIHRNLGLLRINSSKYVVDYIYNCLLSNGVQNRITSISVGSTQALFNLGDLKKIRLPLPPLPEQQKIAAILSTLDEQISTTDKIIEKSKELKKGLMQKLFSEGIGHTEFKDTKIGRIPKYWDLLSVDKCILKKKFSVGKIPKKDYFKEGSFPIIDQSKTFIIGYSNHSELLYNGNLPAIIYGDHTNHVKYVNQPFICGADGVKIIQPLDELDNKFIYYSILYRKPQSEGYRRHFSILKEKILCIPTFAEQQEIASILSEADAKIEKEQTQKAQLEALKKGLMQQLLTGKKRVKV